MTKAELQNAVKLGEITDTPTYKVILNCARDTRPRKSGAREAITIVNDEGYLQGWLACLDFLETIATPDPRPEQPRPQDYYTSPSTSPESK